MDWNGVVEAIYVAERGGGSMRPIGEVTAVEGRGLEEDRYSHGAGTFSDTPGDGRHVTLIEAEAIDDAESDVLPLADGQHRRNVVTRGVALNDLIGHEFSIGDVRLHGTRLCEPCAHLASVTDKTVLRALAHRGGLRTEVVRGGTFRVGDSITP
jgi:MOSC domain-containing protein YiiM